MKILTVIPARGGSKGIPRKNVRFMAGKPLIFYAINCALKSEYDVKVVVTTDNEEIQFVAQKYGAQIIERPDELSNDFVTLDPVIYHATKKAEENSGSTFDIVITMQPTSPLLSTKTLDDAISFFLKNDYDTVISGINDPRLSWKIEAGEYIPNYDKRLNRQYMSKELKETGAFVISKREFVKEDSRFGNKIAVYEIPEKEAGDIDTPQDWWIAETELNKKNILIRVDGYLQIGMGHIYRGLQLAYGLIEHNVRFVLSEKSKLGIKKIEESNFKFDIINNDAEILGLVEKYKADIVINDILNTETCYIRDLKSMNVRVINFEDEGAGAEYADAVVNALYEKKSLSEKKYYGSEYYLIRDEFVMHETKHYSDVVNEILVLFGGTDPCDLTNKTVSALLEELKTEKIHLTVILGMGYEKVDKITNLVSGYENVDIVQDVKIMSEYMSKADIAISSQGRTMLELAAMGVPTILMSANEREATHEFGTIKNGYLNLGFGNAVTEKTICETVKWLINCPQIRRNMHEQMLEKDLLHGFKRVKKIILGEE